MGTGMTMPGDGFRFGQVRHWHQAEGSFFMMCFSMSSPVAAKRILDLVVVSGLETSRRKQEYVFFSHSSSKFWIGRVNVSAPCYHSGYAYTTCGTPEYFAPEMAGIPRNP